MKDELKKYIEHVKSLLKKNLIVDEVLTHRLLGRCVYTAACREMEKRVGSDFTLFVEHQGEIKEVTLRLMEHDIDGQVLRLQELTSPLAEALQEATMLLSDDSRADYAVCLSTMIYVRSHVHHLNRVYKFPGEVCQ